MSLTTEQYRDKDAYEKLAVEAGRRIKPGEERIWEVLPYDPDSPHHKLSVAFVEPRLGIDSDEIKNLMSFAMANYNPDNQDVASVGLEQIIGDIRQQVGQEIREIFDSGEHIAVNVDHQSRFSPLLASELVQLAVTGDQEDQDKVKAHCDTIITRYIGCFGVKLYEVFGNKNTPIINALDLARIFSGIIPIFPDTEIKELSGIDTKIQEQCNAKAILGSIPKKGTPVIRAFCASAASDEPLESGGYRMRTVDHKVKRLFGMRKSAWNIISIATNIDPDDPSKNFFIPSEITPADEYTMNTLDEHSLWIAQTRQERTGEPVIYEPSKG